MAMRRIRKEIECLDKDPNPYLAINPSKESLYKWKASVMGPENTPYYGGVFHLDIQIPERYPFEPPKLYFKTRIYHPNIDWNTGFVSLELLGRGWSPAIDIKSALEMVRIIMEEPDPDNPIFNHEQIKISRLCMVNRNMFNETARRWTLYYALRNTPEGAF